MNFRSGLIRSLRAHGHEVIALAARDRYSDELAGLVDRYLPVSISSGGTNPIADLRLFFSLHRMLRQLRPDVYLGFTIKPNIYGSLAAHLWGLPVINNISGLGATFMRSGPLNVLVKALYRVALKKSRVVFFQNADDRDFFIRANLVQASRARMLPGSGVDLNRFKPTPIPRWDARSGDADAEGGSKTTFRFLLMSRLLRDKGVLEFMQAARELRSRYSQVEFALLGACGVDNPAAISRAELAVWEREGVILYLGETDCVEHQIAQAHCVVLPSYREGIPRALLEAAACGRPVIATDVPGCREVVIDGETGFLCRVKAASDLADKMQRMLVMSQSDLSEMGMRGRSLVEERFAEEFVISEYLKALRDLPACV